MKVKITLLVTLSILIAACGESQEKIIGLYKYSNKHTGTEKIAEIKKDGDTYLFIENVLQKSNAIALTQSNDGLSYQGMELKLSEDGNTIYFGPINGARINSNEFDSIITGIEKNKGICSVQKKEVSENNRIMKDDEWNNYVKSVREKLPKGCHIPEANERISFR